MIHDTQGAQISQKQDERNIYIKSWKQCALLVIATMALWKLNQRINEPKNAQQVKQGA